uniref:Secreted protein n=1 Tax=Rhipicephalus appendiculatus TaxID=34631 RepID=A0A131YD73_RHIAP
MLAYIFYSLFVLMFCSTVSQPNGTLTWTYSGMLRDTRTQHVGRCRLLLLSTSDQCHRCYRGFFSGSASQPALGGNTHGTASETGSAEPTTKGCHERNQLSGDFSNAPSMHSG